VSASWGDKKSFLYEKKVGVYRNGVGRDGKSNFCGVTTGTRKKEKHSVNTGGGSIKKDGTNSPGGSCPRNRYLSFTEKRALRGEVRSDILKMNLGRATRS